MRSCVRALRTSQIGETRTRSVGMGTNEPHMVDARENIAVHPMHPSCLPPDRPLTLQHACAIRRSVWSADQDQTPCGHAKRAAPESTPHSYLALRDYIAPRSSTETPATWSLPCVGSRYHITEALLSKVRPVEAFNDATLSDMTFHTQLQGGGRERVYS